MLRMSISICIAAALFIGTMVGNEEKAASEQQVAIGEQESKNEITEKETKKEFYKAVREHKGHFKEEEKFIIEHAKELGIDTENKELGAILKEIRKVHVMKQAEVLGIDTKNKDFKVLEKDVRETVINNQAKELGISTEGKDFQQLAKEVKKAHILKLANELNIDTEDKDHHELTREVHEKLILQSADKLGIDAKGKTSRELLAEIMSSEYREKAKELKVFPFNSQFGQYFSVPKEKGAKTGE